MKKILFFVGTRPEAIKMCPLIIEFKKRNNFEVIVCLTGQHKEMLDSVMDSFSITSDYNLKVMRNNQSLEYLTTTLFRKISKTLEEVRPSLVFVHGDTTTAFVAAMASFYKKIDIVHVEAGLRTNDIYSPFPEEFNRQSIDIIAKYLLAPTEQAKFNLVKEGKLSEIIVTGNTGIDSLKYTIKKDYMDENLDWVKDSKFVLLTCHRRENIGKNMENIFKAVRDIVKEIPNIKVIYPVHPNPVVREIAFRILGNNPKIRLIEPLDVEKFHNYMNRAYLILTDSGGIQEEASFLHKPVIVLRNETERPEGIISGSLLLVGTEYENIKQNVVSLLENSVKYEKIVNSSNPFGDGKASERIVDFFEQYE